MYRRCTYTAPTATTTTATTTTTHRWQRADTDTDTDDSSHRSSADAGEVPIIIGSSIITATAALRTAVIAADDVDLVLGMVIVRSGAAR